MNDSNYSYVSPIAPTLLGFSFFSFLFLFFLCCITLYKFILYITRGVSNKAVEKDKIK